MSIISNFHLLAVDTNGNGVLIAALGAIASVIAGYLLARAQRYAADRSAQPKKSQQQVAVDVMVRSYDQSLELLKTDRDYWKGRALAAEEKLPNGQLD